MKARGRVGATPVRRLAHFTPLRYPGGKAKLAAFVKRVIELNGLCDGEYVEPYAGGAAIALELLFHEYVARVHINDISRPLYAFWSSVLGRTEELARLIRDTRVDVGSWKRQKNIFLNQRDHDDLTLGFATFFLNRTNRSGILNGGIIGGLDQTGPWKIDARFNAQELIYRIESIASFRDRIELTNEDAYSFLARCGRRLSAKTLIYLDPPYYSKGKDLYYDYYVHDDHERIAHLVASRIIRQKWIVSYDNIEAVRRMYNKFRHLTYAIGYSARRVREGKEVMFFCDGLNIPPIVGTVRQLSGQQL